MKQLLTLLFIGLTSLFAQTIPSYVPTNGLVGWWPFNGNANDESGNGYNASIQNAQLTLDRFGSINSAFNFTAGSYLIGSSVGWPINNQPRTISLWYFGNNLGQILPNVCGKQLMGYGGTTCGDNFIINFDNCDIPNSPLGKMEVQGHCLAFRNYINQPMPYNQFWHHISITFDNGNLIFYINGQQVTSINNISLNTGQNNNSVFVFGAQVNTSGSGPYIDPSWPNFDGKIDDIGVWSRALSQLEINNLYLGCLDTLKLQPQDFTAYTGTSWANFKCESTDSSATYQWQQNSGAGWSNLSNLGNFSGATSDSLVITGVTASMNNYGYRCIVTSCKTDTSDMAVLTVVNGIGLGESTLDKLTISPNPTNGLVSLNTIVFGTYELLTLDGRVLESGTAQKDYDLTTYPKGVYHLRLSTDEGSRVLKVVKN